MCIPFRYSNILNLSTCVVLESADYCCCAQCETNLKTHQMFIQTTSEKFEDDVFTLKTNQKFSVHTTPDSEKFENGAFTLKTHQMFSVHATSEEFENITIISHFEFVFEENSVREITI